MTGTPYSLDLDATVEDVNTREFLVFRASSSRDEFDAIRATAFDRLSPQPVKSHAGGDSLTSGSPTLGVSLMSKASLTMDLVQRDMLGKVARELHTQRSQDSQRKSWDVNLPQKASHRSAVMRMAFHRLYAFLVLTNKTIELIRSDKSKMLSRVARGKHKTIPLASVGGVLVGDGNC